MFSRGSKKHQNNKGLSHNQYGNLQIGKEGLIFNNSGNISNTQLAGYINTGRAVLTTGMPIVGTEGDLRGFNVSQGAENININAVNDVLNIF